MPENNEIEIKVAEALQKDVRKGIVRIDKSLLRKIGVVHGDLVEIIGKRSTNALAGKAYPADVGLEIVRMDGLTRSNTGTSISKTVTIRKAEIREAKKKNNCSCFCSKRYTYNDSWRNARKKSDGKGCFQR